MLFLARRRFLGRCWILDLLRGGALATEFVLISLCSMSSNHFLSHQLMTIVGHPLLDPLLCVQLLQGLSKCVESSLWFTASSKQIDSLLVQFRKKLEELATTVVYS